MTCHADCQPPPLRGSGASPSPRSSSEASTAAAPLSSLSSSSIECPQNGGTALGACAPVSVQAFLAYEVSRESHMMARREASEAAKAPAPGSGLLDGFEEEKGEAARASAELAVILPKAKEIAARLAAVPLGVESGRVDALDAEAVEVGSTNRMVRVWNRKDPKKSCAVKFFGKHTGKYINRNKELRLLSLLGANDVGKEIFATFEEGGGGLIESWLTGASLEPTDLLRESAKIASEMARMHAIDAKPECLLASTPTSPTSRLSEPTRSEADDGAPTQESNSDLWKYLWKFLNLCKEEQESAKRGETAAGSSPDARPENADCPRRTVFARRILLFDLEMIEERLRQLQALAKEVQSPIVLCHGDLLSGNIIKTDEGDVRFIDFDYSGFMERGFDIANHFAEYSVTCSTEEASPFLSAGVECDFSRCPTEAERDAFLRTYVRALRLRERRAQADSPAAENGQDVEAEVAMLRREIKVFFPLSNILWGLWALIQAVHVKPREMNYWRFALDRLTAAIAPPVPHLSF
ncbi:gmck2p, related [Neospora caninum Liverpool]|uniref:ethanolamine kinase n=1 Tax=Neospora caninum (strain Liverpool) TaxID=572307 RepID=F0VB75_NEOCL|nr:gmck2p, related [Neospora caninum Liverpool]CBZ51412.1 gmck2p, related [Neospora caninum Liverpool]CEL68732.1 TPA: GmCK2p, related [Neospora caninum Liverpool]|eukprot:XP_003881445.1 gmck2p, related [Neospora caninum Liverpool]